MRFKTLFFVAIALFVVAGSPTYAQNKNTAEWPQFRGPNGTGVAEGSTLPAEFSSTKNLAWKATVPFARSSPVVTADRVFLTASEDDKLIKTDRQGWTTLPTRRFLEATS